MCGLLKVPAARTGRVLPNNVAEGRAVRGVLPEARHLPAAAAVLLQRVIRGGPKEEDRPHVPERFEDRGERDPGIERQVP